MVRSTLMGFKIARSVYMCGTPQILNQDLDTYAVVTISKLEVFLPEPIIPSWDMVYHALPGGTGKAAVEETFTGAAVSKGATAKVTDQEWLNRVVLVVHTKSSMKRKLDIKIMRQSSKTSRRKLLIELSLEVGDLMASHLSHVVSREVADPQGGKVLINLTVDVTGAAHWTRALGKAKDTKATGDSSSTDAFVTELLSLSTTPASRDKFLSYLGYKDNAKALLAFFETYMGTLADEEEAAQKSKQAIDAKGKVKRAADAQLDACRVRKQAIFNVFDGLLKDAHVRKLFLEVEFIQKTIAWSCDPRLSSLAVCALSSLKPLFAIDSLQETLVRAGLLHFLIHILNPSTEYGKIASDQLTYVASHILPYFSSRFHPIFIKADVVNCIQTLLHDTSPLRFQRGVEMLLFVASGKPDLITRFLPIFDSSLAHFAKEIKATGEALMQNGANTTPIRYAEGMTLIDPDNLIDDFDAVWSVVETKSPSELTLHPIVMELPKTPPSFGPAAAAPKITSAPTPPPAPGAARTLARRLSAPPAPAPPKTARERNATEIDDLSRQIARMLDDPNANEGEMARLLAKIDALSTEPDPVAPAPVAEPSVPDNTPEQILVTAHVGLDEDAEHEAAMQILDLEWASSPALEPESLSSAPEPESEPVAAPSEPVAAPSAPIAPPRPFAVTPRAPDAPPRPPNSTVQLPEEDIELLENLSIQESKKRKLVKEEKEESELHLGFTEDGLGCDLMEDTLDSPIASRSELDALMQALSAQVEKPTGDAPQLNSFQGMGNSAPDLPTDSSSAPALPPEPATPESTSVSIESSSAPPATTEEATTIEQSLQPTAPEAEQEVRRPEAIAADAPETNTAEVLLVDSEETDQRNIEVQVDAQEGWSSDSKEKFVGFTFQIKDDSESDIDSRSDSASDASESSDDEILQQLRQLVGVAPPVPAQVQAAIPAPPPPPNAANAANAAVPAPPLTQSKSASSSAAAPPPPPHKESAEVTKLRQTMHQLERAVSAPLKPIIDLVAGNEERYVKSGLVGSLLAIMTHCLSTQLKVSILALIEKILLVAKPETLMSFGYLDAVLSLSISVCSQMPQTKFGPLPPHVASAFNVLGSGTVTPTLLHAKLVTDLLRIPTNWFNGLHSTVLSIILRWDLATIGPLYPPLIHTASHLFHLSGQAKVVADIVRKAIIPANLAKDVQLPKENLYLLARLLRDKSTIQQWLQNVYLASCDQTFLPFVDIIIAQKATFTKSHLLKREEKVLLRQHALLEAKASTADALLATPPASMVSSKDDVPSTGKDGHEKRARRTSRHSDASSSSGNSSSSAPHTPAPSLALTTSTDSLGTTSPNKAKDRGRAFTLLDLLEGAICTWSASSGHASKCYTLGHFILKLLATHSYNEDVHKIKTILITTLGDLSYIQRLLSHNTAPWVTAIQADNATKPFVHMSKLFLKAETATLSSMLRQPGFHAAYFNKLDYVANNLQPDQLEMIKQLISRWLTEGSLWKCALSMRTQGVFLAMLPRDRTIELGLHILQSVSKDESAHIPVDFFLPIMNACVTRSYFRALDILKIVISFPIFWRYVGVYGSNIQEALIRLYFIKQQPVLNGLDELVKEFLDWHYALDLARLGFFVRAFRMAIQESHAVCQSFMDTLLAADARNGYRILKATWALDRSNHPRVPGEALPYVTGALADADIKGLDPFNWVEIHSAARATELTRPMDWTLIAPGAPVLILASQDGTVTFGGLIPRMPKIVAQPPNDAYNSEPFAVYVGTQLRVTDHTTRVFYKGSVAKPTTRGVPSVHLQSLSADFLGALTLQVNTVGATFSHGNYSYTTGQFPVNATPFGTNSVRIFSTPPFTGITNLECFLSIAIEQALPLTQRLIDTTDTIRNTDAEGVQLAEKAALDILKMFTPSNALALSFHRRICIPGYDISTDWKPLVGKTSLSKDSQITATGCFACLTETRGESQIAVFEYNGKSDPLAVDASHDDATAKPVPPIWTHFLLACTLTDSNQVAPYGVIVFISEKPLPVDDIAAVPCASVADARRAKWPVPPRSVIAFNAEKAAESLVRKSPLTIIPMPLRGSYILVRSLSNKTADTTASVSPCVVSMVLLGKSHSGPPKSIIPPKIPHLLNFFTKANIVTSAAVRVNNDLRGIIYSIGTKFGQRVWKNPYSSDPKEVNITLSHGLFRSSVMWIGNIIGRDPVATYWGTSLPVWFQVDLVSFAARPTHFALRHGYEQDNSYIRNWALQGSNDAKNWTDVHKVQPVTHKASYETIVYTIDAPAPEFYRYWRVITYSNYFLDGHSGNPMLCCSGFDLFGQVTSLPHDSNM